MTSKEALKVLYIGGGKAYSSSEIYEAKYVLEKDLEVLELLKDKLELVISKDDWDNDHYFLLFKNDYIGTSELNYKDFMQLKEWLEQND